VQLLVGERKSSEAKTQIAVEALRAGVSALVGCCVKVGAALVDKI
jgi:hypothetical protein